MVFQYRRRDPDAWDKRANQQGGEFQGIIKDDFKTFTPAKGDNFLRILPPTWEDATHYGLDVYVHYGIGPERASALCISKMGGHRCPICEASIKAEKAGDDELAKELKSGKRVLVWMFDRKDEQKGPMLWSMPWTLDRDFAKLARDPRSGEIYTLDDPDDGYDISFEKTGEKQQTKYIGSQIARKPSSVPQDFIDYVVEFPIPTTLVYRTYDELRKLYEGGDISPPADDRRDDRRDDPPPREREREREPERDSRRDDPPREARRDDPPPASNGRAQFKPRGAAPQEREPEREREREPAGAAKRDDDIPWDKIDRESVDRRDEGRREPPRDDPPREGRRDDPPPRRDDPPPASSGKSRAQELKERFGRR